MASLGIQIDWSLIDTYFKLPIPYILHVVTLRKGINFSPFFPKLMGSGTYYSKIDGFPGTHANGATETKCDLNLQVFSGLREHMNFQDFLLESKKNLSNHMVR